MPSWLSKLFSLGNIKTLPSFSSVVANLCLTQRVSTDGCLVKPSIAGIKETGTDPLPREHWTMPSRYALLNLHLFQCKVTHSPVGRHKDLHCGQVQGGNILGHFASKCLIFTTQLIYSFFILDALGSKTFYSFVCYRSMVRHKKCSDGNVFVNDMEISVIFFSNNLWINSHIYMDTNNQN